jgi:hypothetical protein
MHRSNVTTFFPLHSLKELKITTGQPKPLQHDNVNKNITNHSNHSPNQARTYQFHPD